MPREGEAVVIPAGKTVLLDSSPPVLTSIRVDGTLAFSTNPSHLSVNLQFIHVTSSGRLQIGTEACPIVNKVNVNFYGSRQEFEAGTLAAIGSDPADGANLGVKGIAVDSGATISIVGDNSRKAWTRLSSTADKGSSSISVSPAGTGWKTDDLVVIASTDFAPNQFWIDREDYSYQTEATSISGTSGGNTQFSLNTNLKYMHYGEGYEKAEVASLTRNIVLTSTKASSDFTSSTIRYTSNEDQFGAHIIIRVAPEARFAGVEIVNFGQKGVLGRYPIHFHQTGNEISSESSHYVKGCSIHNSFQRGVVIHDSDNILVENNVLYSVIGHGYFLEDGSEQKNTFLNNFGAVCKEVLSDFLIPSEDKPAVFWVTNPNNRFVGNVAADSHFGFWYSLPDYPNGLSTAKYANTETIRPRKLPLLEFKGNVAHSMYESGAFIDRGQRADGSIETFQYLPRAPPYKNPHYSWAYPGVDAIFDSFIAYKCRNFGFWARGDHIILQNSKLLGNLNGVLNPAFPGLVRNSLIVGESGNKGNPVHIGWLPDMDSSRPVPWSNEVPLMGALAYDASGPSYFQNIEFRGFHENKFRKAGAISVLRNGGFVQHPRNQVKGMSFPDNSNRFLIETFPNNYNGAITQDGPRNVHFLDLDGSVTGTKNGWIISNDPWMAYPGCTLVTEWNAYSCPATFRHYTFFELLNTDKGKTDFKNSLSDDRFPFRATVHRLGDALFPNKELVTIKDSESRPGAYRMNLLNGESYTIRFADGHPTPPHITMFSRGLAPGEWIHIALPYPVAPSRVRRGWGESEMTAVSSVEDIGAETYYYDSSNELLHIKMLAIKNDGKSFWGFEDYMDDNNFYRIEVPCSGSSCAVNRWQNPPAVNPAIDMKKNIEYYHANIGGCNVSPKPDSNFDSYTSRVPSNGKAQLQFDRKTFQLYYHIQHSIPNEDVTVAHIHLGSVGQNGPAMFTLSSAQNPIRGRVEILTIEQYKALLKGNFYINIHTRQYPGGQARGQIVCEKGASGSSCGPVETLKSGQDSCEYPSGDFFPIFTDQGENTFSLQSSDDHSTTVLDITSEKRCGSKSALIGLTDGHWYGIFAASWSSGVVADGSRYKHLQFYVKKKQNTAGSGDNPLHLSVMMDDVKSTGGKHVRVESHMISNRRIVASEWSLVRIPLSLFGLNINNGIRWIVITQYQGWLYGKNELYIDNIGLIDAPISPIFEYWNDGSISPYENVDKECSNPTGNFCIADRSVGWVDLCKALVYACGRISCDKFNEEWKWCTESTTGAERERRIEILYPLADEIFDAYQKQLNACSRSAGRTSSTYPAAVPSKQCAPLAGISTTTLCKAFDYACSRISCAGYSTCNIVNANHVFNKYYQALNQCSRSAGILGYVS